MTFGLVFAATAWHWIDADVRYEYAAELLRPGGHLAFWPASHVFPAGGDPFIVEILHSNDEIGESTPKSEPRCMPGELPGSRQEIETERVVRRCGDETVRLGTQYIREEYLDIFDTLSGHRHAAGPTGIPGRRNK